MPNYSAPGGSRVRSSDSAAMHEQWNRRYVSNRIKTTRYTWWNFAPRALLLQFTKIVNCFYVVNTVLQSIPSISTNDPIYASFVLMLLILIGMLKEALADWKRYKTDLLSNGLATERLTGFLVSKSEAEGVMSEESPQARM